MLTSSNGYVRKYPKVAKPKVKTSLPKVRFFMVISVTLVDILSRLILAMKGIYPLKYVLSPWCTESAA